MNVRLSSPGSTSSKKIYWYPDLRVWAFPDRILPEFVSLDCLISSKPINLEGIDVIETDVGMSFPACFVFEIA